MLFIFHVMSNKIKRLQKYNSVQSKVLFWLERLALQLVKVHVQAVYWQGPDVNGNYFPHFFYSSPFPTPHPPPLGVETENLKIKAENRATF